MSEVAPYLQKQLNHGLLTLSEENVLATEVYKTRQEFVKEFAKVYDDSLYYHNKLAYRITSMEEYFRQIRNKPRNVERAYRKFTEKRNEIVNYNFRLVSSLLRKYHIKDGIANDMFQVGVMGLMHAAALFEPQRGMRFSTYAYEWVKTWMYRTKREQSVISTPQWHEEKKNRAKRFRPDLIALSEAAKHVTSLDNQNDPDSDPFESVLGAADSGLADAESMERFETLLVTGQLSHREETILRLRYGDGQTASYKGAVHTLDQIGEKLNLCRERVRQIEKKALEKMKLRLQFDEHGFVVVKPQYINVINLQKTAL